MSQQDFDVFVSDLNRANIIRKEKAKWEAKQLSRVRLVLAPGQLVINTPLVMAQSEREKNKARYVLLCQRQYEAEQRARGN